MGNPNLRGRGEVRSTPSLFSQGGSLLPSIYADVRALLIGIDRYSGSDSDDSSSDEDSDSEGDYDEDDVGIPMMLGSIGRQGNLPVKKESFTRRSGTLLEPLIEEEEEEEEKEEEEEEELHQAELQTEATKSAGSVPVAAAPSNSAAAAAAAAAAASRGAGNGSAQAGNQHQTEVEEDPKHVGPSRRREQDGYNAAITVMQAQKYREEKAATTIQVGEIAPHHQCHVASL